MTSPMDEGSIGSQPPSSSRPPGPPDQHPFDSYWIGFTDGSIVYAVDLHGRPGSVSEEQAQEISADYYDRLSGS